MNGERSEALQGYDEAKRLWRQWQGDPAADAKILTPWVAIESVLTERFGQHPRQAAFTARLALDSVLDTNDGGIHG